MPLEYGREGAFPDVVRLMAPQPGRFELAIRLAVICALTVLVVEIYQTPDAALTVYVVFFLNKGNRTVSLILNVVLLALITVIIGFVLLVAMVVINDPMWRVISMSATSIAILFVASASKLRPLRARSARNNSVIDRRISYTEPALCVAVRRHPGRHLDDR
jgi:multidrug resistance protein MdtO